MSTLVQSLTMYALFIGLGAILAKRYRPPRYVILTCLVGAGVGAFTSLHMYFVLGSVVFGCVIAAMILETDRDKGSENTPRSVIAKVVVANMPILAMILVKARIPEPMLCAPGTLAASMKYFNPLSPYILTALGVYAVTACVVEYVRSSRERVSVV